MTSRPTILILAAGRGTRMESETPKVLHELCGRPLGLWPVHAALQAGAGRVIVVGAPDRALEPLLPEGVELVVQERADGTGGAVRAAAAQAEIPPEEPVVVLSGDVPLVHPFVVRDLVEVLDQAGAAASLVTTELPDPSGYGRVIRDANGLVERVVETKSAADGTPEDRLIHEVNTGVYAFQPRPLLEALPRLTDDNAQRELYLPDVLREMRAAGLAVVARKVYEPGLLLGVNDRVQLARVRAVAQRQIHEAHMRAGVTIVDPRSTRIDVGVRIGRDARVEPFTQLLGETAVGERASVGPQTTAIDARIEEEATVRVAWLERAHVGPRATVGPFAYLRPDADLGAGAKAGTFVEIKNSTIADGAKVPHLSYIGDAEVGARTNLGAGTITANYDGRAKHRTTIGAGVKGGVHTSLIAPVSVGDGSWTAAGSVITHDVPADALAVARSRQSNIEGYAKRHEVQDEG